MVLLLVLVFAIAVATLRGGKVSNLTTLPLRWPAAPLLAFATQVVIVYLPPPRQAGILALRAGILLVSYLVLLAAVWVNRRLPGMALVAVGLLLNLAVMLANGGYMPITPETVQRIGHGGQVATTDDGVARVGYSKDVVLPRDRTRLWFLSDVFVLPPPFPIPSAFSPGDVLVAVGGFILVQRALLGPAGETAHPRVEPAPAQDGDRSPS